MVRAGAVLLVLSVGAIAGYLLYLLFRLLYTDPNVDVPLVIQVAAPVALAGFVVLVAAVARDTLRARRREHFEEAEH